MVERLEGGEDALLVLLRDFVVSEAREFAFDGVELAAQVLDFDRTVADVREQRGNLEKPPTGDGGVGAHDVGDECMRGGGRFGGKLGLRATPEGSRCGSAERA